jgi:hypothetical protein
LHLTLLGWRRGRLHLTLLRWWGRLHLTLLWRWRRWLHLTLLRWLHLPLLRLGRRLYLTLLRWRWRWLHLPLLRLGRRLYLTLLRRRWRLARPRRRFFSPSPDHFAAPALPRRAFRAVRRKLIQALQPPRSLLPESALLRSTSDSDFGWCR